MLRPLATFLAALLLTAVAAADPRWDLPDIGSPADTVFTRNQAESIGRTVLRQLREQGVVLEDPEVAEYIPALGQRIVPHAHEGEHRFSFFVVNEDAINAFALPGGYIGINTGLITATRSESELAGVLAHEIAHVTQNHIARRIAGTGKTSILATAAILAAILLGAGGDMVPAVIASAQGLAVQEQINYTRANEYEADRVGLEYLARAEFDPKGMPSFFEVLSRQAALPGSRLPEFLQTHPLSSTRVAETWGRAERIEVREVRESRSYALMRARIEVFNARSADDALVHFEGRVRNQAKASSADRYGYGLALLRAGRHAEAVEVFRPLLASDENTVVFHSALGEALILSGRVEEGLAVFERAVLLFPRNRPLVVRHAEALLRAQDFARAHAVLLDLFNAVRPTPPQVRLIANAADAAGLHAEALFYMAEYHLLNGDLPMAVDKLHLALRQPELQSWQRARFEARLAEIEPFLGGRRANRAEPEKE
jgi:predicted Zn-dependent protease